MMELVDRQWHWQLCLVGGARCRASHAAFNEGDRLAEDEKGSMNVVGCNVAVGELVGRDDVQEMGGTRPTNCLLQLSCPQRSLNFTACEEFFISFDGGNNVGVWI